MVPVLVHWAPAKGRKSSFQRRAVCVQPVVADMNGMFIRRCHPCISWRIWLQANSATKYSIHSLSAPVPVSCFWRQNQRAKTALRSTPSWPKRRQTHQLKLERTDDQDTRFRCRRNMTATFPTQHRFVKP
ncbi:hypothetical protein BJG94_12435 [Rhizobium sp. Td3]|nr:hypothetical protein BJG94_12435 [Rhizobium sp. Td3]